MTTLWQRLHAEDPALPEPTAANSAGVLAFRRSRNNPVGRPVKPFVWLNKRGNVMVNGCSYRPDAAACARLRHLLGMPPKEGK